MATPFIANGLTVEVQPLAEGIYKIICDAEKGHLVAFGMIPVWAVEMFERLLREKVIAEGCKRLEITPQEANLLGVLDEKAIKETVRAVSHQVTVGIYAAAARAGKMIV